MPSLIDKLFKSKLQARNFSPEAGDWAAMEELINADLGSGSASSMSINWMVISVISLLLSVSIYADTQRSQTSKLSHESTFTIESSNTNILNSQKEDHKTNTPNTINSVVLSTDRSELVFEKEDNIENITANTSSSEKHRPIVQKENNTPQKNDAQQNLYSNREETSLAQNNNVVGVSANSTAQLSDEIKHEISSSSSAKKSNDKAQTFSKTSASESQNSIGNIDPPGSFSSSYIQREDLTIPTSNSYQLYSQSITSLDDLSNKQELNTRDEAPPFAAYYQKQRRKLPIQLSIAAFGELSYITKKIKGVNEYRSLIQLRDDQEKNMLRGGVGIEVQAKYKQFGFSTGLSLQNFGENVQYEEKFTYSWDVTSSTYTDTTYTQDIVITIDTVFIPNDSLWYIVMDTSYIMVVDSIYTVTSYDSTQTKTALGLSDQNGKTTVSYWEIPLYFSYQFDMGDFYLSPGIGVTIGFLKVTRGYYMAEDLNGLIELNTNYAVFKKTLINGQINLGIGYKLGDNWSVEATPTYRFNLTNILENPDLIQRYSNLSLQFRIRYYF